MSVAFADSSALVKLDADEPDAGGVRSLPHLVVSELARVEVPAALWRKSRVGELSTRLAAVLVAEFEADDLGTAEEPPRFLIIRVTPAILGHAARLVGVHGLRAYDAVQLGSAAATHRAVPDGVLFAVFDDGLRDAAAAETLPVFPEIRSAQRRR